MKVTLLLLVCLLALIAAAPAGSASGCSKYGGECASGEAVDAADQAAGDDSGGNSNLTKGENLRNVQQMLKCHIKY